MERSAWTDERLDDLVTTVNTNFDRVWEEIRDMRVEMRDMRAEMRDMRSEMHAGFERLFVAIVGTQGATVAALIVHLAA